VALLIFNKVKTHGDVLYLDASREYKEARNRLESVDL
jgi:type I restriction-modification system DNA methylase subunit